MLETIHIYHTNDLHSHFDRWPKISKFVTDMRKLHSDENEQMLLVDIGDHVDRFHPITEATFGKKNVELLNMLEYDYVTIGNNEGITLSYEQLETLYKDATFQVLLANFFDKDGNLPNWAIPFDIYTLSSGVKIGLKGLTVHYASLYKLLGWNVKDPVEVIKNTLEQVKKQADLVILLSHLGINEDERIASEFPDIDIILGAHTHHLLPYGKRTNQTLLCAAQKYGNYIGHVKLVVDTEKKEMVQCEAEVIETETLLNSEEMQEYIQSQTIESINELHNEIITKLTEDLEIDWYQDSPFSELLARTIREWCQGEIAMVNAGLLLDSLPKGIVTRGDLHRVCPHPINPCKVKLKGDQLKEIILHANTQKMEHLEIKGLGFRGKVMGKMVYDGVQLKTRVLSDGLKHVESITINGEELDPDKMYSVATIDMFTFGKLFPEIRDAKEKEYFMPELLREVLAEKLRSFSKCNNSLDKS